MTNIDLEIGDISMTNTYTHILDLAKEAEPPDDGILSRTIFDSENVKAVVFGFGQVRSFPNTPPRSQRFYTLSVAKRP